MYSPDPKAYRAGRRLSRDRHHQAIESVVLQAVQTGAMNWRSPL